MGASGAKLDLSLQRIRCLKVCFLSDVAPCASICDSRHQSSGCVVKAVMATGKPEHVIAAGGRQLLRGFQFDAAAGILDVLPAELIRKADLVVPRRVELIECAAAAAGRIAV